MLEQINVPDIGDYKDVQIIAIAVKVGDEIKSDAELMTLETDKATMEIPAPKGGMVKELLVKVGDKVSQGSPILMLEVAGSSATASKAQSESERRSGDDRRSNEERRTGEDRRETSLPVENNKRSGEERRASEDRRSGSERRHGKKTDSNEPAYAGPGVRRFARELGVDINRVEGSGRKSRVLEDDVKNFVKDTLDGSGSSANGLSVGKAPAIDFSKFGDIKLQPLNRIQKISGEFLHRNWVTIPHVTQFDEADITELEIFRKGQKDIADRRGVKLTPLIFLLKAVVAGLKQYPKFNSSLAPNSEDLVLKNYFNIGVAVDTPNGLVVPVIRDVDKKGLFALAEDLAVISQKARDGKLTGADMQGGCFTISSLGGIGGTAFTPIINAPEVAILGVSKAQTKPIFVDGNFEPRLMLPLSLSYDHRVIDGADAVRFTSFVVNLLGDIRRLLL